MSHFYHALKTGVLLPSAMLLALLAFAAPASAVTHRTVPITGAQDVLIDNAHQQVDVTTNTGTIQRYSLTSHALLTPWTVGTNLRSLDIPADGSSLYIVDQSVANANQGVIHKVNTATGANTNLLYDLAGEGAGGYDIVRLSTNQMMFTANHQYSGASPPVRLINLTNDAISLRQNTDGSGTDFTERQTDLFRSADGTRVFLTGGNTSAGNVRVYDAPSNSYLVNTLLYTPLNGITAALSPDGSILAFQGFNVGLSIDHAADLSPIQTFANNTYRSALGYTPNGLLVFGDWDQDLFRFYDPATSTQVLSIPAGFNLDPFVTGNLTFSANGQTMAYQDGNGLQLYEGLNLPEPSTALLGLAAITLARRRPRPTA